MWISLPYPSRAEVVRGIRNLEELIGRGGMIQATCRGCEKAAIPLVPELAAHFRAKRWNNAWPGLPRSYAAPDRTGVAGAIPGSRGSSASLRQIRIRGPLDQGSCADRSALRSASASRIGTRPKQTVIDGASSGLRGLR
jgi:hypothetical protein